MKNGVNKSLLHAFWKTPYKENSDAVFRIVRSTTMSNGYIDFTRISHLITTWDKQPTTLKPELKARINTIVSSKPNCKFLQNYGAYLLSNEYAVYCIGRYDIYSG